MGTYRYSAEFRADAVALAHSSDRPLAQVARDLGVNHELARVLDQYSRRLAGWSIADHMRTDLVTDALKAAAATRGGTLHGAIFHSDNGAQYASKQFAELCDTLGVVRSRGAVGTSVDNAAAESFNATLKAATRGGTLHSATH